MTPARVRTARDLLRGFRARNLAPALTRGADGALTAGVIYGGGAPCPSDEEISEARASVSAYADEMCAICTDERFLPWLEVDGEMLHAAIRAAVSGDLEVTLEIVRTAPSPCRGGCVDPIVYRLTVTVDGRRSEQIVERWLLHHDEPDWSVQMSVDLIVNLVKEDLRDGA